MWDIAPSAKASVSISCLVAKLCETSRAEGHARSIVVDGTVDLGNSLSLSCLGKGVFLLHGRGGYKMRIEK